MTDSIVKKFYTDVDPPNRVPTPPPKVKLDVTEVLQVLNEYINKCIRPTKVLAVTRNRSKYIVEVTDTDCDAKHGAECKFIVDKVGIDMTCSKCTGKPRRYLLNKKSKEILFPNTK